MLSVLSAIPLQTLALCATVLLLGSGCPANATRTQHTLDHAGRERSYLVHVPPSLPEGAYVPLLLALHPFAGTGESMANLTGLDGIADAEQFIVCYPDGVTLLWNGDPTDESGKQLLVEDADDVGFIDTLLDRLIADYPIDSARVYVCGASNGGLMAHRLACELAERFAAAASVMITLPEVFPEYCAPARPVPMLMIQGTDDPFFPWEGGSVQQGPSRQSSYLSAAATVDFWIRANQAETSSDLALLPDVDPTDGTRVVRETYPASIGGAPVVFYRVNGGGHTWPGSTPSWLETLVGVGPASQDLDASRAIWAFFSGHSLVSLADP